MSETPTDNRQDADLIAEPTTGRDRLGRILPGTTGNPHGRPRKGQTLAERLAKADAKVARDAIKARDKRLKLENAVGQKAWESYLAYTVGLPVQKYHVQTEQAPADELYARIAGMLAPPAVDVDSNARAYTVDGTVVSSEPT